eukprot:snap_masked-scaffold_1-processed-gene-15.17-mRNA-1 protein AED:1.00 eAED:1.00 QI:0/-1/0/0/-1/1/1/0/1069
MQAQNKNGNFYRACKKIAQLTKILSYLNEQKEDLEMEKMRLEENFKKKTSIVVNDELKKRLLLKEKLKTAENKSITSFSDEEIFSHPSVKEILQQNTRENLKLADEKKKLNLKLKSIQQSQEEKVRREVEKEKTRGEKLLEEEMLKAKQRVEKLVDLVSSTQRAGDLKLSDQKEQLERIIGSMNKANTELTSQLVYLKEKNEEIEKLLSAERKEFQEKNNSITKKLTDELSKKKRLKEKSLMIEEELFHSRKINNQNLELKTELKMLQTRFENHQKDFSSSEKQKKDIKKKLISVENENEGLKETAREKKAQIEKLELSAQESLREERKLIMLLENQKAEKQEIKTCLNSLENTLESKEKWIAGQKEKIENLETQFEKITLHCTDFRDQIKKLKEEKRLVDEVNKAFVKEKASAVEKIKLLEQELNAAEELKRCETLKTEKSFKGIKEELGSSKLKLLHSQGLVQSLENELEKVREEKKVVNEKLGMNTEDLMKKEKIQALKLEIGKLKEEILHVKALYQEQSIRTREEEKEHISMSMKIKNLKIGIFKYKQEKCKIAEELVKKTGLCKELQQELEEVNVRHLLCIEELEKIRRVSKGNTDQWNLERKQLQEQLQKVKLKFNLGITEQMRNLEEQLKIKSTQLEKSVDLISNLKRSQLEELKMKEEESLRHLHILVKELREQSNLKLKELKTESESLINEEKNKYKIALKKVEIRNDERIRNVKKIAETEKIKLEVDLKQKYFDDLEEIKLTEKKKFNKDRSKTISAFNETISSYKTQLQSKEKLMLELKKSNEKKNIELNTLHERNREEILQKYSKAFNELNEDYHRQILELKEKLKENTVDHEKELIKRTKKFETVTNQLQSEIIEYKQYVNELKEEFHKRYENRESRVEDVNLIAKLKRKVYKSKKKVSIYFEQMKTFKKELDNKEQIFDTFFPQTSQSLLLPTQKPNPTLIDKQIRKNFKQQQQKVKPISRRKSFYNLKENKIEENILKELNKEPTEYQEGFLPFNLSSELPPIGLSKSGRDQTTNIFQQSVKLRQPIRTNSDYKRNPNTVTQSNTSFCSFIPKE